MSWREELPDGLLGVLFDDDRGFVGVDCLTEDDDLDEGNCVTVFDRDAWFTGDICKRCLKLMPPGKQ